MQTVTFPCAFCGKRMGVGENLLGKRVRCPNCKEVVTAPDTAPPAAAPPAQPVAPPPPPPPEPVEATVAPPDEEPMFPIFSTGPKESAESILSPPEESEDEVFGKAGGNKFRMEEVLRETEQARAPEPAPNLPDNPFAFSAAPPAPPPAVKPPPPPPPAEEFVAEVVSEPPPPTVSRANDSNPFASFEAVPATPQPAAPPPPAPAVVPAPPVDEWGTFGGGDELVAEAVPEKAAPAAPRRGRAAEAAADDPTKPWRLAVYILAPYALLMTILAIAGFAGGSSKSDTTPQKKRSERTPAAAVVRSA